MAKNDDADSDLVSTGEAAAIADTSRQAVLQASKSPSGKLPVAKKGPAGENLYERKKVLEWARTVKRRPGRGRPAARAPRPRPVLSPPVAAEQPPTGARQGARGPVAGDPVPPSVMQALLEKVTTPNVLEQYEALLLDDAANRRGAAEVARLRVDLDRLKVQVERRRIERELRMEERPNNVRQVLGRLKGWLSKESGRTGDDVDLLLRFGQRVLDALGDDLVAETARGGMNLEEAYLRTKTTWSKWLDTSGLQSTDPRAHDEFVRLWVAEMKRP